MNSTIYQIPTQLIGSVSVLPNFKFMVSGDDLAAITTPGYLNTIDLQSNPISSTDILQILYDFNPNTQVGKYGAFTVTITNDLITLEAAAVPGEIILPVVDRHFANFIGTTGAIGDLGFVASNNLNSVIPTLNLLALPPADGFVPAFIGTDGSIGMQLNGSPYSFNGAVIAGSNSDEVSGALVALSGVIDGSGFSILCLGNPAGFNTALLDDPTLGQNSEYNLPDPGVSSATIAVFADNPSVITPGNLIVAGAKDGVLADGGTVPSLSGAVLLSPPGNQVITTGHLTLESGSLILGLSNTSSGLLQLLSDEGTAELSIYNSLTGASADFAVAITTALTIGQPTTYTIPDPGAANATFNVTATSVTAGNILAAGATNGVLVDSGVAVSQLELVANIVAQQTGNIGGAGVGPLTVTQAACTAGSVINVSVAFSSNPCFVQAITAGGGSFDVTMSADPGASLILNYVLFVAPQ